MPYDQIRIQGFLSQRVQLDDFCFVLEHRLNPQYAYKNLAGDIPDKKSMNLVKKADQLMEVGHLVFHLIQYWLKKIHGSPRVLILEGIDQELETFWQELLERKDQDMLGQVGTLFKELRVDVPKAAV